MFDRLQLHIQGIRPLLHRNERLIQLRQRLAFDLRDFAEEIAVAKDNEGHACNGREKEWFLFVKSLAGADAFRNQIQFDRALRDVPQGHAHEFTAGMRDFRQVLQIESFVNRDLTEWIEVFDRRVEFFGEELRRVRHGGTAARQKHAHRRRAALLPAIKLDGLVDLDVQPGQHLPRNFRNGSLLLAFRLLVRAAKSYEAFVDFYVFSLCEGNFGLGAEFLRDRVRADVQAASKKLAIFEQENVRGFRADIEEQRASVQVRIVVAKRVTERGRTCVHDIQL